jgi:hypothetical protein
MSRFFFKQNSPLFPQFSHITDLENLQSHYEWMSLLNKSSFKIPRLAWQPAEDRRRAAYSQKCRPGQWDRILFLN